VTREAPSIAHALAAVMAQVREVRKTETNSQQGFKFRGIDAVVNAVGPALRDHGVIVVPDVLANEHGTVEVGRNRTPMGHVKVHVRYSFYGPAGDSIQCSVVAESMDSGDKATAKAMSVAFRTALLQALCLPTDEPDPDSQVYERSPGRSYDEDARVPEQRPADPAVAIRQQIGRWAEGHGYTPDDAAARFAQEHDGQVLWHESNPSVLNAFFAAWQKEHQTRTAEGATA
jgi:hypothetical protein